MHDRMVSMLKGSVEIKDLHNLPDHRKAFAHSITKMFYQDRLKHSVIVSDKQASWV
jgi:hypothetical protein